MTSIHVWTAEGQYVGQIFHLQGYRIHVEADDEEHRVKITDVLLNAKKLRGDADMIDIRAGGERMGLEFATADWIALASLLLLPAAGYRVHIIRDAARPPTGTDL